MTDALGRFASDLDQVSNLLADHSAPDAALAQALADQVAANAPRVTGALAASISATADSVDLAAPYAGVINDGWPARNIAAAGFIDSALDSVDLAQPYLDAAAEALDSLRPIYT